MSEQLIALLVHDRPDAFADLARALKDMLVETYSAATCQDARELITAYKPHLIFTETFLRDGSWMSFLDMAAAAKVPLNVIVVGTITNIHTYVSVIDCGAFDFIAPPFDLESLEFVVHLAEKDVRHRREAAGIPVGA